MEGRQVRSWRQTAEGRGKEAGLVARRVSVVLVDDLDGSAADRTVTFELDGHGYEIDLSTANEQALRVGLAPFVAVARPANDSGAGTTWRRPARNAATGA